MFGVSVLISLCGCFGSPNFVLQEVSLLALYLSAAVCALVQVPTLTAGDARGKD